MFRSMKNFILPPLPLRVIEKLNNEVRMGDLDYFFENILPHTPPELNVNRVFDHCVNKRILVKEPQSEGYTWKFVPKDMKNFDNRGYVNPFMKISRSVIKAAQETISSNIAQVTFIPKDGGKEKLSDNDDHPEEKICPYVYFENRNVRFKGRMEDRHWYTSGFGFHFKESDGDYVSNFNTFFCYLL